MTVEMSEIRVGSIVRLLAYGGECITRRVVLIYKGDHVGVCKEAEYQAALAEGRTALAVGFRIEDVVEVLQEVAP